MALTSSRPIAIVNGTTASSSAMNVALGIAGGLFVNTQTAAAAVAAKSVDGCFTAAAWGYRIYGDVNLSTGGTLYMNLRASGADNTTAASYRTEGAYWAAGAVTSWSFSTTYWEIASGGAENVSFEMMIYRPFETAKTRATWLARNDGSLVTWVSGGSHTQAASYDGFTIGVTGGTMTGDIVVHSLRGDK